MSLPSLSQFVQKAKPDKAVHGLLVNQDSSARGGFCNFMKSNLQTILPLKKVLEPDNRVAHTKISAQSFLWFKSYDPIKFASAIVANSSNLGLSRKEFFISKSCNNIANC